MSGHVHSASRGITRWLVVALLGAVAAGLLIELGAGSRAARGQVSTGRGEGIVAVAGRVTGDSYGLYLLDLQNGTISVYQYLTGNRQLRLMAVRNYTFDVQLDSYNTDPPPRDIKALVQQQQRLTAGDGN